MLYPTSKGAIVQMTRSMAAMHGSENIRVNCVCPGLVYTPMVRGKGMSENMRAERSKQNMLKQEGSGWDVGYGMSPFIRRHDKEADINIECAAILFLCSKEAKWITGLIMPIDGGVSLLYLFRVTHFFKPSRKLTWLVLRAV